MRFREFKAILSVVFPDASFTDQIQLERILNIRKSLWQACAPLIFTTRLGSQMICLHGPRYFKSTTFNLRETTLKFRTYGIKKTHCVNKIVFPNTCLHIPTNGSELIFGREENGDAVAVRNLSLYPISRSIISLRPI